jgi:tetratricopeptide (TPR) repeat protein
MKNLLFIGLAAIFMLIVIGADAQQTVSPFGTGQDSIRCRQNLSLLQTSARAHDYRGALAPWTQAYENCPASSINIYIYGARIFAHLLSEETDPARRQAYVDRILGLYDRRMELFPGQESRATVLTLKTRRYIEIMDGQVSWATVHKWLGEALDLDGANILLQDAFWHYLVASQMLFQMDNERRDQYIEDYFRIMGYIDLANASAQTAGNQDAQAYLESIRESLTAAFIGSGAGDCETIIAFYAPQIEANRENSEFLNGVLSVLITMGCRDSDLFFTVSQHLHRIEPTVNSALGMATRAQREGDMAAAMRYFTQAAELETDGASAARFMMQVASILAEQRNFARARQVALESLTRNPNNGAAYILIARLYGATAGTIFPDARTAFVFNAAVDLLRRAITIDPSVAAEANGLINNFSQRFMDAETAFMLGIREGESVHIPGWINVTTTIRFRQ